MSNKLDKILEKVKEEGDFKSFEYRGYKCMIRRMTEVGGHLCGYIGVPKDHKLYKKHYDEIENELDITVHGGLTYSDYLTDDNRFWYIGFDCAHAGDLMPMMAHYNSVLLKNMTKNIEGKGYGIEYRDMAYVEKEIKGLVDQINDI